MTCGAEMYYRQTVNSFIMTRTSSYHDVAKHENLLNFVVLIYRGFYRPTYTEIPDTLAATSRLVRELNSDVTDPVPIGV